MKALIIYYSQTGNTKTMAEAIARGMRPSCGRCDLVRLQDARVEDLARYDLIGVGGPVQRGNATPNVLGFIEFMKDVDGKLGFAFCTHGALPGYFISNVVPALTQRGLTMLGWKDWFAAAMFPAVPKPYFTDGHPDEIDLAEAEEFGRELVDRARRVWAGETDCLPTLPTGSAYDEIYNPFPAPDMEILARWSQLESSMNFTVYPQKCNYPKCTYCIDNCPTRAIDFSLSPPVFGTACIKCWSCEQTCPRGAIEVDYLPWQKLHDHLTVGWLQKAVEAFEASGKFRRLVPMEEIGWDTPVWTLKRPRFRVPPPPAPRG